MHWASVETKNEGAGAPNPLNDALFLSSSARELLQVNRRDADFEGAAFAHFAVDRDGAAVQFDDLFDNRQPRARTLIFILGAVNLVKTLPDIIKFMGWYTPAMIFDPQVNLPLPG